MKHNDATGHKRGEGPYSSGKLTFDRPPIPKDAREIYGEFDQAANVNGGYTGKLPHK